MGERNRRRAARDHELSLSAVVPSPLARYLDATLLSADATADAVRTLVVSAAELGCAAVCVNPVHVEVAVRTAGVAHAARRFARDNAKRDSPLRVASVVGFPLGASPLSAKMEECRFALERGATELDIVIPIWAACAGDMQVVEDEVAAMLEVATGAAGASGATGATCKVIVEMALLGQRLGAVTAILGRLRPAFAKTGTGYQRPVTAEDVRALRALLDPAIAIKAAGGIRTRAHAEALIEAGAARLGTSRAAQLLGPVPNPQV